MEMRISGNYDNVQADYAERVKEKQAAEMTKEAKEADTETAPKALSEPKDEYISSEKSGKEPAGLYRLGQDVNGSRKIFFDDPNRSDRTEGKEQPKPKADGSRPGSPSEKCVTDTDRVDREIEKLKEKKQQLEQQIRSASGDEKKVRELEKELAQVESELSQKDNDTYRRQNAFVSG